ncbi:hypothetical protein PCASD_18883 [Puccinia coronata f. sp. avenae]|uniref:Uncharacterized protein n=1 Tax=Puccinia coronata f. sp. avenae TaxID=200324 RepID=A0A2N5UCW5_9BASI|nr:hypothetical protein PCASD_18883 [Puccinia coronata f. sp. avenae]
MGTRPSIGRFTLKASVGRSMEASSGRFEIEAPVGRLMAASNGRYLTGAPTGRFMVASNGCSCQVAPTGRCHQASNGRFNLKAPTGHFHGASNGHFQGEAANGHAADPQCMSVQLLTTKRPSGLATARKQLTSPHPPPTPTPAALAPCSTSHPNHPNHPTRNTTMDLEMNEPSKYSNQTTGYEVPVEEDEPEEDWTGKRGTHLDWFERSNPSYNPPSAGPAPHKQSTRLPPRLPISVLIASLFLTLIVLTAQLLVVWWMGKQAQRNSSHAFRNAQCAFNKAAAHDDHHPMHHHCHHTSPSSSSASSWSPQAHTTHRLSKSTSSFHQ